LESHSRTAQELVTIAFSGFTFIELPNIEQPLLSWYSSASFRSTIGALQLREMAESPQITESKWNKFTLCYTSDDYLYLPFIMAL